MLLRFVSLHPLSRGGRAGGGTKDSGRSPQLPQSNTHIPNRLAIPSFFRRQAFGARFALRFGVNAIGRRICDITRA